MNLIQKGREIGYTPQQVRKIIEEQRELLRRETLMCEVLACSNLEDIKILLMDWVDKGYIK